MMKANTFRTEIICSPNHPVGLHDPILTMGSCFADQLGDWLRRNKFQVLVNPFGTTYNPISIHNSIIDAINENLDESLFIENYSIWHHFSYHSKWSSQDKETLKKSILQQQKIVRDFIKKTSVLVLTYGTAWVYEHNLNHEVVANCHKVPASYFDKKLLSDSDIVDSFNSLLRILKEIRPDLRVIITVSPVRHIKDTLELNSVSKATLRLASYKITEQHSEVDYFPSYEIMMDDLRDYRFYERDKIHPSEEAIDYISTKFTDIYFTAETKSFIERWNSLRQSIEHKAYHPESPAHQYFLKELLHKLEEVNKTVSVAEEIKTIKSQIHSNA